MIVSWPLGSLGVKGQTESILPVCVLAVCFPSNVFHPFPPPMLSPTCHSLRDTVF